MEWIKVEDEKPRLNALCLCAISWNGKPHGYKVSKYYKMSNCDLEVFSVALNSQALKVTHWQEIEPPKEG